MTRIALVEGTYLLISFEDGRVAAADVRTGSTILEHPTAGGPLQHLLGLTVAGRPLAVASTTLGLHVWDLSTGRTVVLDEEQSGPWSALVEAAATSRRASEGWVVTSDEVFDAAVDEHDVLRLRPMSGNGGPHDEIVVSEGVTALATGIVDARSVIVFGRVDGELVVFDVETRVPVDTFRIPHVPEAVEVAAGVLVVLARGTVSSFELGLQAQVGV